MQYKSMRKIYYLTNGNEAEIQKAYEARMNGVSTYKTGIKIGEYPGFVVITPEILNTIAQIYKNNTLLQILIQELPEIAFVQYFQNMLVDEIGSTNEIENIHSTRREIEESLKDVERDRENPSSARFAGMIAKYLKFFNSQQPLITSCADIRKLYDELVLDEVLKEAPQNQPDGRLFRKEMVYVRNKHEKMVHEGLYPESEIERALELALDFLGNEDVQLLVRISAFHYLFGYIHPFYDGNGRMSRFISSSMLVRDFSPLLAIRLSYVIRNEKSSYYKMFRDTNESRNRGDLTEFVILFLQFISDAMDEITEVLKEKLKKLTHYKKLLEVCISDMKRRAVLYVLIQNSLFSEKPIDIKELESYSRVSQKTIKKAFLCWTDPAGFLQSRKSGNKYLYRLDLEAFDAFASSQGRL